MSGIIFFLLFISKMLIDTSMQNLLLSSGWRAWASTLLMLGIMNKISVILILITPKSLNLALLMNKG